MSLHKLLVKQARIFEAVCEYAGREARIDADCLRDLMDSFSENSAEISRIATPKGTEVTE